MSRPAICVNCLKVRQLSKGNPPPCKCGSNRIVWLFQRPNETLKQGITRLRNKIVIQKQTVNL